MAPAPLGHRSGAPGHGRGWDGDVQHMYSAVEAAEQHIVESLRAEVLSLQAPCELNPSLEEEEEQKEEEEEEEPSTPPDWEAPSEAEGATSSEAAVDVETPKTETPAAAPPSPEPRPTLVPATPVAKAAGEARARSRVFKDVVLRDVALRIKGAACGNF